MDLDLSTRCSKLRLAHRQIIDAIDHFPDLDPGQISAVLDAIQDAEHVLGQALEAIEEMPQ